MSTKIVVGSQGSQATAVATTAALRSVSSLTAGGSGAVVVLRARFAVSGARTLTVSVTARGGRSVVLLRGSRVGSVVSGRAHRTLVVKAPVGTIDLALRVSRAAVARGSALRVVAAGAEGQPVEQTLSAGSLRAATAAIRAVSSVTTARSAGIAVLRARFMVSGAQTVKVWLTDARRRTLVLLPGSRVGALVSGRRQRVVTLAHPASGSLAVELHAAPAPLAHGGALHVAVARRDGGPSANLALPVRPVR